MNTKTKNSTKKLFAKTTLLNNLGLLVWKYLIPITYWEINNITRIKTECKKIFETKIIKGSDVNKVYSVGKNVYKIKEKLATANKFW